MQRGTLNPCSQGCEEPPYSPLTTDALDERYRNIVISIGITPATCLPRRKSLLKVHAAAVTGTFQSLSQKLIATSRITPGERCEVDSITVQCLTKDGQWPSLTDTKNVIQSFTNN